MAYKPETMYITPFRPLYPVADSRVNGVPTKAYEEGPLMFCSFKSFGGTERIEKGLTVVEDTAVVECHYDPSITSGCRIKTLDNNRVYEILGTPEDIGMQHKTLRFKVRRVAGDT